MSEVTNIEWADSTFNPWEGCTKVGPGCDNCYAENRNARFAGGAAINWGAGAPRRRTSASNWQKPVIWNSQAGDFFREHGRKRRVFCASLADVFDNAVPREWRIDLFRLIRDTPNLDWLLLTKRIGNVVTMLADVRGLAEEYIDPFPWPNIWLGATIVNQAEADRDISKLLDVPARVRFLSMEPLLGPVNLSSLHPQLFAAKANALSGVWKWDGGPRTTESPPLDWVIVGGESGPGARPMSPDWARSLRDQCEAAGVPFLFKQWGEWIPMLGQVEGVPVREKTTRTPAVLQLGRSLERLPAASNTTTGS